jgi:hypothetical protein
LIVQWIFGAAVVLVYAADRFKTPRPTRWTTTFWRYWSAWCGYLVAMTGIFMLLGGAFTVIDASTLVTLLDIEAAPIDAKLPGPVMSALLLTSLLPHVRVLRNIDSSVKEWFERVGNIPYEVRELSARLREAAYDPSPPVLGNLVPQLGRFGVDPKWLKEPSSTIKQPWAQVVTLFAQAQAWEGARGYARYFDENKAALNEIEAKLDSMGEVLQPLALAELDSSHESALVPPIRKQIANDIAKLRKALFDYVSGGVLNEARNHAQRYTALTQLGFTGLPTMRSPLSANDIVLVMGLVFLAILFIPLVARRFVDPVPLAGQMRLFILIPTIYAISVVAAIYPKSAWRFASREAGESRPVAAYAASAALAAIAAFVVALLLRFAFDAQGNVFQVLAMPGAFAKAWATSLDRWPWQLSTFFVTVAIAWLADDWCDAKPEPAWLRWMEAVALCLICVALQWAVVQLFAAARNPMAEVMLEHLGTTLAIPAVIGAGIGWLVPHTYRLRGRQPATVAVPMAVPVSG